MISTHSDIRDETELLGGNVDGIFDGKLRGWVHITKDGALAQLSLLVDGKLVAETIADGDRPDVARRMGSQARCGFEFDLTLHSAHRNSVFAVTHKPSEYDFHGERWRYCQRSENAVSENALSLRKFFYPEFYRYRYGFEALSNEQSFAHFLHNGIYRDLDPCPWLSSDYLRQNHGELISDSELPILAYLRHKHQLDVRPSALFCPEYYAATNPELDHVNLLEHHVQQGNAEGHNTIDHKIAEPVLHELSEMISIEPSIALIRTGPRSVVRHGFPTASDYFPILMQRRFGHDIEAIVCVPFIATGDADLIGIHLLRAYQLAFAVERVLLIVTEHSTAPLPDWLDPGTRVLYLEEQCKFAHHLEKVRTLHNIVGLLAPSRTMNVNSLTTWDMYRKFGLQMTTAMELNAYVFRFDQRVDGRPAGYISDYVPDLIEILSNVYCDNQTVIEQMRKLYGFSSEDMDKFNVLYVPTLEQLPQKKNTRSESRCSQLRRPVLWIGHLSDHKRPDLLVSIAAAMPSLQFVVYGPAGKSSHSQKIIDGEYPNISYRGVYSNILDIKGEDYSLFLNTTTWEGLPNTIIHMVGMGVPVVTALVGGIAELVNENNGWPVADNESILAYVAQISSVLIQGETAELKAQNGLKLFSSRHTWNAFYQRLEELGLFADPSEEFEPASMILAEQNPGKLSLLRRALLQKRQEQNRHAA